MADILKFIVDTYKYNWLVMFYEDLSVYKYIRMLGIYLRISSLRYLSWTIKVELWLIGMHLHLQKTLSSILCSSVSLIAHLIF